MLTKAAVSKLSLEMDVVASELDSLGWKDLGSRIDLAAHRLRTEGEEARDLVARRLVRVKGEMKKRLEKDVSEESDLAQKLAAIRKLKKDACEEEDEVKKTSTPDQPPMQKAKVTEDSDPLATLRALREKRKAGKVKADVALVDSGEASDLKDLKKLAIKRAALIKRINRRRALRRLEREL